MNYNRIYNSLINKRKVDIPSGYVEVHHIQPKSMGGTNDKDNLVRLTAREHYIAHHLLYRIHKNGAMAYAWFAMSTFRNKYRQGHITSVQYESSKKAMSKEVSKRLKGPDNPWRKAEWGEDNPFYGKHHTPETCKQMSDMAKRISAKNSTPEARKKNAEGVKRNISKLTYDQRLDKYGSKGSANPMYGVNVYSNKSDAEKEEIANKKRQTNKRNRHKQLHRGGVSIIIDDKVYKSIAEGSRQTKYSYKSIRNALNNKDIINIKFNTKGGITK